MADKKVTFKYILAVVVAVIFTWLMHEFAHWLTAVSLGYEVVMTLNTVSYVDGENPTDWHRAIVSIAGPAVTILQAIFVFIFLKSRDWNKYLYPLLFAAFYMRVVAGALNIINPNDEGRISLALGIGTYTLPIMVSGFLFYLIFAISKKYGLNWKFQLATYLVVMTVSSILVMSDQFIGVRIL